MNQLQKILRRVIAKYAEPKTAMANIVIAKLEKSGHHIDDKHKAHIRKAISTSQDGNLKIQFDDGSLEEKLVSLVIHDSDIENYQQAVIQAIHKTIPELAEDLSVRLMKETKRGMKDSLEYHRHQTMEFEWRLRHYWGRALDHLELFLGIATEIGEAANSALRKSRPSKKNNYLIEVLTRQQARACQVGTEILRLLESGLADGAYARWRTLHEIAVVSLFISEHGNVVAERYLLHETVESYRAAEQFNKYAKKLGYTPVSKNEITTLQKEVDRLCEKFGKDFKMQYGWASAVLKNESPKFSDIEAAASLDHLRPYYKLASHNVHAQPKGVFYRMGLLGRFSNALLAGPSNVGLDEAASFAVVSITQITMCVLAIRTNMDSLVYMHLLSKIGREIDPLFRRAQRRIEKDDRKHSRKSTRKRNAK